MGIHIQEKKRKYEHRPQRRSISWAQERKGGNYMYGLRASLIKEQERLRDIRKVAKERLEEAPEGTLRISKSREHVQFYHYMAEEPFGHGKYIHRSQEELVQKLAQKDYDAKLLRLVERRLKQIERILKDYQDDEIEQLYLKEHAARRARIEAVEPTWENQLEQWQQEKYEGKGFQENDLVIYSEKGERVRSKSEKILADFFYRNNIPYKYERPLPLKGYGIVYPDFTFLSPESRQEIYWEHEGKMDEPGYARAAVKKIQTYEENGIYVGERLILSFETDKTILNTNDIERKVKSYLS